MNTKLQTLYKTLILVAGLVSVAHAANRSWQNGDPLGGNFSDSSRWSGSATPGADDTATFSSNNFPDDSEFTVTLTENITNQWIRVAGNNRVAVTLDLNGYTYSTTSTDSGHTYFQGADATLILTGGTATFPVFSIARSANTQGKLVLTGSTTVLNSSGESFVGNAGAAEMVIQNAAKMTTTGNLRVAHGNSGVGTLKVSGNGSSLTSTGAALIIGHNGQASLEVSQGGKVLASGGGGVVRFALGSTGDSSALITGQNSSLEAAEISIGGSGTAKGGVAEVYVVNEATMVSRGALLIYEGSLLEINNAQVRGNQFTGAANSALSLVLGSPLTEQQALLTVSNNVDLANMNLNLSLGDEASFSINEVINLVQYGGALTGQFSGIDDGDILNIGTYDFRLSYGAGTASSISLTVVPEPGTVVLLIGGATLLWNCGRRKFYKVKNREG